MDRIQADVLEYLHSKAFLGDTAILQSDESLTSAGIIDSIGLIQLIDYLEGKYHVEIPLDLITPENFDTIAGIERTIRKIASNSMKG